MLKSLIQAGAGVLGYRIASKSRFGIDLWSDLARLDYEIDVVVDVGANVGQWASRARSALRNAHIISFEPEPGSFAKLRAKFACDALHESHMIAVSDREGIASLRLGTSSTTNTLEDISSHLFSDKRIQVRADTLTNILDRLDVDRVGLLKIDVEGHEIAVLHGAADLFAEKRVDAVLAEVGFGAKMLTPFKTVLENLTEKGLNFLQLYDAQLDWSHMASMYFANALFVRSGVRFTV